QDEKRRGEVGVERALLAAHAQEEQQPDDGLPVDIVVERPQRLDREIGQEPALAKQRELVVAGHAGLRWGPAETSRAALPRQAQATGVEGFLVRRTIAARRMAVVDGNPRRHFAGATTTRGGSLDVRSFDAARGCACRRKDRGADAAARS